MNERDSYPSPLYSGYVLTVLLSAYILSFVDRNVLALLVGPIRAEYNISDFQFSILHGWAFTLFYIFLGLPVGYLADRYSRKWIITVGVGFWSLMTCLCGFARNFWMLFITRVGVGVGEAALSPPTYSLLSDYFPAHKLRWATAIFACGITLGSGASYMLGGWLYDLFAATDMSTVPVVGGLKPWQLTFIAVGLPGFVVVALLFLVKEPPRRRQLGVEHDDPVPISEVLAWARQHWKLYCALMMGVAMMSVIGYGTLTWFPEFLFRTYEVSKAEAGTKLGLLFMIFGTAGTLMGAALAGGLQQLGYRDANLRLFMLAAATLIVPATVAPLMPDSNLALLVMIPVTLLHYTHFGVAMAALQLITPNRMRAQMSALLLFIANLFGLALGGSVVAFFTDFVFGGDVYLRYSLACVAAIVYPAATLLVAWGLAPYRAILARSGVAG